MRKLVSVLFSVALVVLGAGVGVQPVRPAPSAAVADSLSGHPSTPSTTPSPVLSPPTDPSTPTATPTPTPSPTPAPPPVLVPTTPTLAPAVRQAPAPAPPAPPAAPPASGSGSSGAGNPAADDTALEADIMSACRSGPTSAACEQASISALDAAMTGEGLSPTSVPADFWSLPYDQQLLLLANGDRTARGLAALSGPEAALDADALAGANAHTDPGAPGGSEGWTANWAETVNSVAAEFMWMYDDGLGSENIDCTASSQSGCWIHREDILHAWRGTAEFGGACVPAGTGSFSWVSCAEIFVGPW